MEANWIIVSEYIEKSRIEPAFVRLLEEEGLIDIAVKKGERCFPMSQLPEIERYSRLYYELSINIEGIDDIRHLLDKMRLMQNEIDSLKRALCIYRSQSGEME